MRVRSRHAVAIALLACGACVFAARPLESKAADEAGQPAVVKVASVKVVDAGTTKGDPRAAFELVNLEAGACYAMAPSPGGTVAVGDDYAVVPASDVDEAVRAKLAADYPKCPIVEVVARVTH